MTKQKSPALFLLYESPPIHVGWLDSLAALFGEPQILNEDLFRAPRYLRKSSTPSWWCSSLFWYPRRPVFTFILFEFIQTRQKVKSTPFRRRCFPWWLLTGPRHARESKIMKQSPFQFSGFSAMTCQLLTKKLIIKGINEIGPTVLLGHIAPYTMELVNFWLFPSLS